LQIVTADKKWTQKHKHIYHHSLCILELKQSYTNKTIPLFTFLTIIKAINPINKKTYTLHVEDNECCMQITTNQYNNLHEYRHIPTWTRDNSTTRTVGYTECSKSSAQSLMHRNVSHRVSHVVFVNVQKLIGNTKIKHLNILF